MAGYNPKDSNEKRTWKAHYFAKSMIDKGKNTEEAYKIASRYYHVNIDEVKKITKNVEYDDDVAFYLGDGIFVDAEEMLGNDFYF